MTEKLSDQWQTPDWLFKQLDEEFHFDIDLCATKENSKCEIYCIDYLNNVCLIPHHYNKDLGEILKYGKATCFMNPPYSNPKPFIEKAWEDSKHCKIVCLVKCDPSTRWWATFWNYEQIKCEYCLGDGYIEVSDEDVEIEHCNNGNANGYHEAGPKPGCEVRFFPKRIKFGLPQELIEKGEVWRVGNNWVKTCIHCDGGIMYSRFEAGTFIDCNYSCLDCQGKGYVKLSGPTFPCALLIFDRRGL